MEFLFYIVKYNKWVYSLYYHLGSVVIKIIKFFLHQDDKLILFISFGGKRFDDSPKSIYDEMIKDHRFDEYSIIWAFSNPDLFEIPRGRKVKCDTWAYFKTALKARVWISNSTVERGLGFKGKNTFYFDTWHGTPIKKMGADIASSNQGFKGKGKWDVDFFCCQSKFDAEIFGRVFQDLGPKQMHIIGLPRNDVYAKYTNEYMLTLKKSIGLPDTKKIILYAPTYREYDKTESMRVKVDIPIDLDKWQKHLGDKYIILFRAHYEVAKGLNIKNKDFVLDMSDYPQLEDLMIVSDILISDYSSIFFDYSIMHKPMISFCYDYEKYSSKRGMYFDIRNYLVSAENEDDLIHIIKNSNFEELKLKTIAFQKEFVTEYGSATKQSLEAIAEDLGL